MKEDIRDVCRRFRKNQTKAEKAFWKVVRNRQVDGYKILRQYPIRFEWNDQIRFFIADFYCHEAKMVIEIDGGINESQKEYDKLREHIIESLGFHVIRFLNNDVLNYIDNVLVRLKDALSNNN